MVVFSGEAGIGKSRLVQVLQEQVGSEPRHATHIFHCSPYHTNSALYSVIAHLEWRAAIPPR